MSHKDTVSVSVVLYCHTKTPYLSLGSSAVTQRHGTSACGALLWHKETVPVPVHVTFYCPDTCPLGYHTASIDPIPVPVILYCHHRHDSRVSSMGDSRVLQRQAQCRSR